MTYTEEQARAFAISLLDDDHGISDKAYHHLVAFLRAYNCVDLLQLVDGCGNRFFLPEGVKQYSSQKPIICECK